MVACTTLRRYWRWGAVLPACVVAALLALTDAPADGRRGRDVIRIGTTGSVNGEKSNSKEKSSLVTLKTFLKDETGLENEILEERDWRVLTNKLAKGQLQVGVYQGYEFAWAQEQRPDLKPLALAINVHRYPVAYVVSNTANKAKDFNGLQGQTFAIPQDGPRFLRFYVSREAKAGGKTLDTFFAKVTTPERIEPALDDVVDGIVGAVVVERAALEVFKLRKPARFKKLRAVAHSQPFPPPVIAYCGNTLDEDTRERFRSGLLAANKQEKGKQMMELFGLTHFETAPPDFGKVLAATRKAYPPAPPAK